KGRLADWSGLGAGDRQRRRAPAAQVRARRGAGDARRALDRAAAHRRRAGRGGGAGDGSDVEASLVTALLPSAFFFYLLAGVTVVSAAGVALGRNILYSAFALLGTLAGVAGLYLYLAADFLGVAQLIIYIGGILV